MVDMLPRVAKLGYIHVADVKNVSDLSQKHFYVSATNFVMYYNVSEVAKLRNIQDTCSMQ